MTRRWPDALLLAAMVLPLLPLLPQLMTPWVDEATFGQVMHVTGELAARVLVATLLVAPMQQLWPRARFTKFLRKRRRWLGVAAFAYTTLHLALILVWRLPFLWAVITPWQQLLGLAAFVAMLPPALSSLDKVVKALGPTRWHRVQQLAYLAAVLAFAHWAFQRGDAFGPATVHFGLVVVLRLVAWATVRLRGGGRHGRGLPQVRTA